MILEKAEDFKLKSINNKVVTLNDIKGEKATLIMFICNHCPYVKAIIKDLAKDCNELRNDGINLQLSCQMILKIILRTLSII